MVEKQSLAAKLHISLKTIGDNSHECTINGNTQVASYSTRVNLKSAVRC